MSGDVLERPRRVAVIGHWGGNIGHDIMACGVGAIVDAAFGAGVARVPIEQHRPFEVYPASHPLRRASWLRHGQGGFVGRAAKRLINHSSVAPILWRSAEASGIDAAIVCGGPVLVPGMAGGDLRSMYHHIGGAYQSHGIPVFNLSLGSCVPWAERTGKLSDPEDRAFVATMLERSTVATVRDVLAQDICGDLGFGCELVADTGFLAGIGLDAAVLPHEERREIVISYQRFGSNETWGQPIDSRAWGKTMAQIVKALESHHPLRFVCHSDGEMALAGELAPHLPRDQPRSVAEYAEVIRGARLGICNRIHAAVAMLSIGTPVVAVGADSRLLTLRNLGVRTFYVGEVTGELLLSAVTLALDSEDREHQRLMLARRDTLERYVSLIRRVVGQ